MEPTSELSVSITFKRYKEEPKPWQREEMNQVTVLALVITAFPSILNRHLPYKMDGLNYEGYLILKLHYKK
jgi:hypothetical protein